MLSGLIIKISEKIYMIKERADAVVYGTPCTYAGAAAFIREFHGYPLVR